MRPLKNCMKPTILLSFRASEVRHGIQYLQHVLDAGLRRHDGVDGFSCYDGSYFELRLIQLRSVSYIVMIVTLGTVNNFTLLSDKGNRYPRHNHGSKPPKQALETDSAASCGVLNTCLCGIIRLTNFHSLRF